MEFFVWWFVLFYLCLHVITLPRQKHTFLTINKYSNKSDILE